MRPNDIEISGDTLTVTLSQGQVTTVDHADLALVQQHRWTASWSPSIQNYYAVTHVKKDDGTRTTLYLHRHLTSAPKGLTVDHINHDTLDNRRQNLRIVTNQINCSNRNGAYRNSKTGVLGVTIWTRKHRGRPYQSYRVQMKRGSTMASKTFPLTPEGLARATRAAAEMRAA